MGPGGAAGSSRSAEPVRPQGLARAPDVGSLAAMAQHEPWSPSWTPSWTTSAPPDAPIEPAREPARAPDPLTDPLPVVTWGPPPPDPAAPVPTVPEVPPVPVTGPTTGPITSAPPTTVTEAFPISRRAPRQARAFVADALHRASVGDPRILDVAQLLTSETTTKAIGRQTGQPFIVAVTVDAAAVVVGLQDGAPTAPEPDRPDDWGATLVDALADEWGADTTERGRVFWFRLHRR